MKLKVEVDVTEIVNYFDNEENNFNEEIISSVKDQIIRGLYSELSLRNISYRSLADRVSVELNETIKNRIDSEMKNMEYDYIGKMMQLFGANVVNTIISKTLPLVVKSLKEDSDFIGNVSMNIISKLNSKTT